MENVTFVEKQYHSNKDKPKDRMTFKVISLGSFMQELL